MKQIIIYFGEMGSGKTYNGRRTALDLRMEFFDGDDVATPEMRERIARFKPLTKEMIKPFIKRLTAAIVSLATMYDGLVVSQALYSRSDRARLNATLTALGFKVEWRWVQTPLWQNMKQLYSRPSGARWVAYWLIHKPFFEKP